MTTLGDFIRYQEVLNEEELRPSRLDWQVARVCQEVRLFLCSFTGGKVPGVDEFLVKLEAKVSDEPKKPMTDEERKAFVARERAAWLAFVGQGKLNRKARNAKFEESRQRGLPKKGGGRGR